MQTVDLPPNVTALLWEYNVADITWEQHRDFILERILARGDWDTIRWARSVAGDNVVREVVVRTRGRWLNQAQLRFWQLVLAIPEADVSAWLESPNRAIWDRRLG